MYDFYSIFPLTKEIKIFRFSVLMFSLFFTRMPASTVYIYCSTAPHTLDVRLSVDVIPCKPTSPTCRERWRGGVNAIDVLAPSKRVMTKSLSRVLQALLRRYYLYPLRMGLFKCTFSSYFTPWCSRGVVVAHAIACKRRL